MHTSRYRNKPLQDTASAVHALEHIHKPTKFAGVLSPSLVGLNIGRESSLDATGSANNMLAGPEAELTLANAVHEQALLRQAEHASHTPRQLEVLCQVISTAAAAAAALLVNVVNKTEPYLNGVWVDAEANDARAALLHQQAYLVYIHTSRRVQGVMLIGICQVWYQ